MEPTTLNQNKAPKIPISVVVVTKNEQKRIAACLQALQDFDEIVVLDSQSTDRTVEISKDYGARILLFRWNGQYPKKYGWCLNHLDLKHDRIFFVDADEIVTPELVNDIAKLDWSHAGYFVSARYQVGGKVLAHGMVNNKLILLDRRKFEFPVVDDLECDAIGEIEGHYQPVLKAEAKSESLGQLASYMIHKTDILGPSWYSKHERYARWEVFMDEKNAWPIEDDQSRVFLKSLFKKLPFRPLMAFLHSYILKAGFRDGSEGFKLAQSRFVYYRMICDLASKTNTAQARSDVSSSSKVAPSRS